jgi:hypothetical protein
MHSFRGKLRRSFVLAVATLSLCFALASPLESSASTHGNVFAAKKTGYGLPRGRADGCNVKTIDTSTLPLIVILLKDGRPYSSYSISGDHGTRWYHFDVPVGKYRIMSTYTGTKSYTIDLKYGQSPRVDFKISCPTGQWIAAT